MPIVVKYEAPGTALGLAGNIGQYQAGQDAFRQQEAVKQRRAQEIANRERMALAWAEYDAQRQQQDWQRGMAESQYADQQIDRNRDDAMQYAQFEQKLQADRQRAAQEDERARMQMAQQDAYRRDALTSREQQAEATRENQQGLQGERLKAAMDLEVMRQAGRSTLQGEKLGFETWKQDDQQDFAGQQRDADRQLQQQGLEMRQNALSDAQRQRQSNQSIGYQVQQHDAQIAQAEQQYKSALAIATAQNLPPQMREVQEKAAQDLPTLAEQLKRAQAAKIQFLQQIPGLPQLPTLGQPGPAAPPAFPGMIGSSAAIDLLGTPAGRTPPPAPIQSAPAPRPTSSSNPIDAMMGGVMVSSPEEAAQLPPGTAFVARMPDGSLVRGRRK
jgi:hypothetical protein